MKEIPPCPKDLPEDIAQIIRQLGKQWKLAAINPKINPETVRKWDNLVDAWLSTTDIPIIVRKRVERGREKEHITTGRKIIISDNSPAQWVCHRVLLDDDVPTLDEIRDLLKNDKLPLSFAVKKAEKDAKYRRTLGKDSINKYGWRLCHIEPVGLNTKKDISQIDIEILNEKFLNLMKPSNFFLLPKKWGGLGESKEFIEEMKK